MHHHHIYLVCFLCAVPNAAIIISIREVLAPTLGQVVRIRCVISEAVSGLSTRPVVQWLNNDGSDVVIGDGVIRNDSKLVNYAHAAVQLFSCIII